MNTRTTGAVVVLFLLLSSRPGSPADTYPKRPLSSIDFGTYHALVIGNGMYRELPRLPTAREDAASVSDVLVGQYAFIVTTLIDATRYQILSELNRLRVKLTKNDNLLIYYTGHGMLDPRTQRGHWLPVDSEPSSSANWIPNASVTDIVISMAARHVLIIADAPYFRHPELRVADRRTPQSATDSARVELLNRFATMQSRMVLTSGGQEPVLDASGTKNSLFAKCLLDVLTRNQDVLEAKAVARQVMVCFSASKPERVEVPEYAPLKYAGHESGDFLFVRAAVTGKIGRAEAPVTELPPRDHSSPRSPALREYFYRFRANPALWPVATVGGFLATYIVGLLALLLLAWQRGSTIFSTNWLRSFALKPLLVTPGIGRAILFIGYSRRLSGHKMVRRASLDYFGLPAQDASGSTILPAATGSSLHKAIASALAPQEPVLIIGKGGAGKSTVLARLTHLGLTHSLPRLLTGYRPVLVPASYYTGSLTKAVSDTLRERDGVMIDEDVMRVQLQSGRFLVLFDGVSEVASDKQQAFDEMCRTARHADYRNCRFVLSTRPLDGTPTDIRHITLQPLTPDVIRHLLVHYRLSVTGRNQMALQLRSFGERPIEPLLFTMMLDQSSEDMVSQSRAQIYERYFRRLLKAHANDDLWAGWRAALESLAECFMIDTGKRGVGLPHELLLNTLAGDATKGHVRESTSARLRRLYKLPVIDELEMLNALERTGLLQKGRRWRFAHDTFEEYFAASYIVSYFDMQDALPALEKWRGSAEREQEFLDTIDFVREMVDESSTINMCHGSWPKAWANRLLRGMGAGDE